MNKEIEPNTRCESYSICCACGKKIFNKDFYSVINGVGLYCRNCYFRLFQNESDYYQLQIAKKDQRIAELEEQLKKSLESNNDLLKQTMELQSQLIIERLKGEKK